MDPDRPKEPRLPAEETLGPPVASNRPGEVWVDELFDELMDLPEEAREGALLSRCTDPSVRDEVRALLTAAADLPERAGDAPAGPGTGDRIAHFNLGTCLGKGASGAVWTAFDRRLQSWTALKIFDGDWARRAGAMDAVMAEARAASGIISDYVVRIKNVGRDGQDGARYIEMLLCAEHRSDENGHERLVVGRTLADESPDDLRECVRLVSEASRGADAAHRVGVVHRDIKPANILVMPVSRRALVADFGLSAPVLHPAPGGAAGTDTVSIAATEGRRTIVGTPCFMAPEQANGEPATRQSDVYALGATLYTVLAKRAPYLEPGTRSDAMAIVRQVRKIAPRPLAELAPHVPKQLLRIVDKAMARDAADRYPTASALGRDLDAVLAHRPTSLDKGSHLLAARLFVLRHPSQVTTAAVLGSMLLVFGIATAWLAGVKADLEDDVSSLETRRDELKVMAERADARAQMSARSAHVAAEGAAESRKHSQEAEDHARAARREVEEITAWAQAETQMARASRLEALEAAAQADQRAAESALESAQALEAQAEAEVAKAGALAELAETHALLVKARNTIETKSVEYLALADKYHLAIQHSAEAELRLMDANERVEALQAQLRLLATPSAPP